MSCVRLKMDPSDSDMGLPQILVCEALHDFRLYPVEYVVELIRHPCSEWLCSIHWLGQPIH